mmetsp:Transcript_4649/g.5867  ORF Transcript_4649/g.5867 Transcript_4649/m.5867 type:complete len:238 (-) Transcript_4649:689-1402(-)
MPAEIPKTNEELRDNYFNEKKVEFETGCDQGNASACFSLGEWYQLIAKNVPEASKLYDKTCYKSNHANSCFNLATLYFGGKLGSSGASLDPKANKLEDDKARALYFHEKACKNGNSQACTVFATLKLHGIGCKPDFKSSAALLENSCGENDAGACLKIGSIYLQPKKEYGIERDPAKAFKFIKSGCDLGHPNCCQILAVMYRKGDGVEKNEKLFEKYKALTMRIVKETGERMGVEVV